MSKSLRMSSWCWQCLAVYGALALSGIVAAAADEPAASTATLQPVPQGNFFSSLKQAFKQDFDQEVVRGHFDVGVPPDTHRYYCLADAKTGKREANGVAGQPAPRHDGMTGIKATAVSLYSCASAEQQGILVADGYVLSAVAGADAPLSSPSKPVVVNAAAAKGSLEMVEVAGVNLGMTVEAVRSVLKAKKLDAIAESTTSTAMPGKFVNIVAAWTLPHPVAGAEPVREYGESYEIMFTPVAGRERAMAIIHSVIYSAADAMHETALEIGLYKKYGGVGAADQLPNSVTWRLQSGGSMQTGDACERRGIVGGLSKFAMGATAYPNLGQPNLALRTALEEFRYQIDHCGVAIITADYVSPNGGASRENRIVSGFTVTAYSPSIALEGATAAGAETLAARGGDVLRGKEHVTPNL